MAEVCVELRMSPPEFRNLRVDEFEALINELKIRRKQEKA